MRIIKNIKLPKVLLALFFILNSNNISAQAYGPLLTDVWGGVNCVDDNGNTVYPLNYYTPNHCSPGCVAISLSQILNFYEWPKTGIGSNVYKDNYNGNLKRHSAFFDSVEYDYSNMLGEYKYKTSTDKEREAVGKLVYHVATALQMNFEPSGSTSNVNKVPFVIQNFLRYSGHYEEPGNYTDFWSRLKSNVKSGNPVQVAVEASRTGDGHAFVVDGYRESDGYYHINWGWYNNNDINGWYDIENWTNASPGYNKITGAMLDMFPIPVISSIETKEGSTDFTVTWQTSKKITDQEFTLEQSVDGGNWEEVIKTTDKSYTVNSPSGKLYKFRVKAKVNGSYYADSWSEIAIHAVEGGYNGYASTNGAQKSYARQTPNGDLNFTNDYTFETWIRVKQGSKSDDVILDQGGAFSFYINNVTDSSYDVEFKSSLGSVISTTSKGKKLSIAKWTHIAVCHSGSTTRLYVNGEEYATSNDANFTLNHSNSAINMAEKYSGGYQNQIKADFDQLRISKVARYNSSFVPTQESQFGIDDNTVAYLTFQNIHGRRYKDEAANLSFILIDNAASIDWEYELTDNKLSNDDLELIASLITVFPNPAVNDFIEITIEDNDLVKSRDIRFNLYNINGQVINIKANEISSNKWRINLSEFKSGIYILQVNGGNFKMNRKIIIE